MKVTQIPIFGSLAVMAAFVGFYFLWRIFGDENLRRSDYTGMATSLAAALWYFPCVVVSVFFFVLSMARSEKPKYVGAAGAILAFLPILCGIVCNVLGI